MALVTLGSKAVGSVVKIREGGTLFEYILIDHNYLGTGNQLLMRKDSIYYASGIHCFDHYDSPAQGKTSYYSSNLRTYLNDNFLKNLESDVSKMTKDVSILDYEAVYWNHNDDTGSDLYYAKEVTFTSKIFILSPREMGAGGGLGSNVAYFTSNETRKCNTAYQLRGASQNSVRESVGIISSSGLYGSGSGRTYFRPCFVLPSNIYVKDDSTITTNTAPTVPGSITVPTTIKGGGTVAISWAASTDAQGNLSGYILERSVGGAAWAQVYKGTALAFTDTITKGWASVAYRVKAYDSVNAMSGYQTSATRTVINNSAPGVPASLTIPASVIGGITLAIAWGAATDSDGNLSGYILERQYNAGSWAQLYKGASRAYTDTITYGWTSVAYRVKAYDSEGAASGYSTSTTRSVFNNTTPVISGSDGSLGAKTGAFTQAYTVTDPDAGQTLTVVEKLDGVQWRSYTATSGASNSFGVSAAQWIKILNGTHTVTITASDGQGGSATRTWTFTKSVTEIEMVLASALAADSIITKGVMNIARMIPAGAVFTVEVCNNGFDASPKWEDITAQVVGGNKFFFSNTVKTAARWGFNIRIKIKRNGAAGSCYIQSAGGNFE